MKGSPLTAAAALSSTSADRALAWLGQSAVGITGAGAYSLQPFVHCLAKVVLRAEAQAVCVVLPDRGSTAAELAGLVALAQARAKVAEKLIKYAQQSFEVGELVRVLPSGAVYEFGGYFPGNFRDYFKLKVINSPSSEARACAVEQVLRLQRTTTPKPKGRLSSDLGTPATTPLDHILGVATMGNAFFMANEVLLLSERKVFEETCNSVVVDGHMLAEVLPWGTINEDGSLSAAVGFGDGEPLCAVTNSLQRTCAAATRIGTGQTLLLVDGARKAGNTDILSACSERQRTVVFASAWEREDISHLEESGVLVWQPNVDALGGEGNDESRLGGDVVRVYRRASRSRVQAAPVDSALLREVYTQLQTARHTGGEEEEEDASVMAAVDECFRILNVVSSWVGAPNEQDAIHCFDRLSSVEQIKASQQSFWSGAIRSAFDAALQALQEFVALSMQDGPPKEATLRNLIQASEGAPADVTLLLPAHLEGSLAELERSLNVTPIAGWAAGPICATRQLVLTSWPKSKRIERLMWGAKAEEVTLLGYEHEIEWLQHSQDRHYRTFHSWRLRSPEMRQTLGLDPADEPLWESVPAKGESSSAHPEWQPRTAVRTPIASVVHHTGVTVEAYELAFHGGGYAFVTPGRSLPRLSGQGHDVDAFTIIEHVHVPEVNRGDLLIFREAGDTEVVSMIAEQLRGPDYNRLRIMADSWRPALRSIGSDAHLVARRLRRFGLDRDPATVHGWLFDESRIGPQNMEDLVFIGSAARDPQLINNAATIFEAIREVRGAHAAAGARLTEALLDEIPAHLEEIEHGATKIDLTFGAAWLVKVESVSRDLEPHISANVNRLLWL